PEMDVYASGIKGEELLRDGDDGGVDLDHIHADTFLGEIHRNNADAQTDAQNILNLRDVSTGQIVQHVRKHGGALLKVRVVNVLDEVIVEIHPPGIAGQLEDLEQPEIRVSAEELNSAGAVPTFWSACGKGGHSAGRQNDHRGDFYAALSPDQKIGNSNRY